MTKSALLAALLLLLATAAHAATVTAKYALSNAGWTDLGAGPLLLSFTGIGGAFAISDATPALGAEGFTKARGGSIRVNTPSHVWGRAKDVYGVSAYVAPITGGAAGGTRIFLTAGTTWTVPSDWNSASNTIEAIGGGGAGGSSNGSGPTVSSGGGGGAYATISNISLTPGATVNIQIGASGAAGASGSNGGAGGDTIFDTTNNTVIAKAGGGGLSNGNSGKGAGGLAASSTPATGARSGGDGAALPNTNGFGGGGGGGAGGPHGAGAAGGASNTSASSNANGGGASDGGSAGVAGVGLGSTGGAGGAAFDATVGGAGGVSGGNGSPGSHGSGGGGGAGSASVTTVGGAGGAGVGYVQTSNSAVAGPGGGGGGGGSSVGGSSATGGAGGLYGGGGAGGNYGAGTKGGNGAQGIIVVTYGGAAPAHSAQALAYLARTVGGNEGGNATNIATLIDGLVADGVWAKLDALYVLAQQNQTDANLNLIGTNYSIASSLLRAATFTSYVGYSNFGALRTGFDPTVAPSPNFSRNNASLGVWSYAVVVENVSQIVQGNADITSIYNKFTDNNFIVGINGAGYPRTPTLIAKGLFAGDRSDASNIYPYQNGVSAGPLASASQAVDSGQLIIGLAAGGNSAQTISAAFIGASLSAAGQLALYNRLRTYMTAVGVP